MSSRDSPFKTCFLLDISSRKALSVMVRVGDGNCDPRPRRARQCSGLYPSLQDDIPELRKKTLQVDQVGSWTWPRRESLPEFAL